MQEYSIFKNKYTKQDNLQTIKWKIFINHSIKLSQKNKSWVASIKLMSDFSINKCRRWQLKMKSSMLLWKIFMKKLLKQSKSILNSSKIFKIGGNKKENKWKLKEKEKDKKLKNWWMLKDKEKDSTKWRKNSFKEQRKKKKDRKINFSLSLKKWKEIHKDSTIISSNLMMLSRENSRRINLKLLNQVAFVVNLIQNLSVKNLNFRP